MIGKSGFILVFPYLVDVVSACLVQSVPTLSSKRYSKPAEVVWKHNNSIKLRIILCSEYFFFPIVKISLNLPVTSVSESLLISDFFQ